MRYVHTSSTSLHLHSVNYVTYIAGRQAIKEFSVIDIYCMHDNFAKLNDSNRTYRTPNHTFPVSSFSKGYEGKHISLAGNCNLCELPCIKYTGNMQC